MIVMYSNILKKIKPSREEEEELKRISREIIKEIREIAKNIDSRIKVELLGSCSRNTWLRYEKDIDIFLIFPQEYPKDKLEKIVERIGAKVLKNLQKKYAEHPYVKGEYKGYEVEIVPCYACKSAENIISAVDRTPFHNEFVKRNISGKEDEVRLLKQFLKGISCYGAEAKVEGFSGYLCELLVIKYGSFENVLKNASKWKFGEVIQLDEKKLRKKFSSALIFIDPVDKNRNVASALSEEKLALFIYASKQFLKQRKETFFFPKERKISKKEVLIKFKERRTELIAIIFSKPDVVDDVLYPQLKKFIKNIKKVLKEKEFFVEGIFFSVEKEKVAVFIELRSIEIPQAKLHFGPFVNSSHESNFLNKYKNNAMKLTEPFIIGKRWAIVLKRKYNNAVSFLKEFLKGEEGIPKHIKRELRKGFKIKFNEHAFIEEFIGEIANYFDPRFPWEY
ncbi:MAG: CCA tRNA nucleotidyltransferase [Candidatus Hydrothermarchaeota archaeon]|nr:MAG: CCA tRNA nucleotidyltransferase [Candidatus Hydrothermarchaeota archaeon]